MYLAENINCFAQFACFLMGEPTVYGDSLGKKYINGLFLSNSVSQLRVVKIVPYLYGCAIGLPFKDCENWYKLNLSI